MHFMSALTCWAVATSPPPDQHPQYESLASDWLAQDILVGTGLLALNLEGCLCAAKQKASLEGQLCQHLIIE